MASPAWVLPARHGARTAAHGRLAADGEMADGPVLDLLSSNVRQMAA